MRKVLAPSGGRSTTVRPRRRVMTATAPVGLLAVIAVLSPLVAVGPVGPVGAQAPDDCSAPVVDTSGSVDVARVELAIAQVDPAATVVVRSFEQVPDGDLVAAVDEVVIECFTVGGEVRSDVIVLGLSIRDGLSDVLIGGQWGGVITDPDRLRTETMGEPFAAADYTGGLVAVVDQIARDIAGDSGSGDTLGSEVADGTRPEPADQGGGRSPWSLAGGVGGLAACGGAFYAFSRRRRLTADREQLEQYLSGPQARLGALRSRHQQLAAQADGWRLTSTGGTLNELNDRILEADGAQNEANRQSGMLTEILPDGAAGAGRAEMQRGRDRAIELSKALDLHDDALDRLTSFGAHLDHLRVAIPTKLDLLDEEIDEALALASIREGEGFAVDGLRTELTSIAAEIDAVDALDDHLDLDLLDLSDRTERTEARLFAAGHYLQSLPTRLTSLRKWNQELDSTADLELKRIDELRRQFLSMTANHASDSWQWAADYPELAVEELDKADELQTGAISRLVAEQRFDEAGEQLDVAGMHLIRADDLLDQVDDLMIDLEQARREAPDIVEEARLVHTDLARFVSAHSTDLDPEMLARPGRFASAIEGLEAELRQIKPNYLRVAETGERLNGEIDAVMVEAEDQRARTEALRRELGREVARARRAIARARRSLGWELIRSSDGSALDELEARIGSLPADPEVAIGRAAEVGEHALRIQERIIARRRRRGTWINTGGGGWVGGGGGWSPPSTPRRSGGGSRPARSGGGRSFGGRRSGGGRSFGGGRSSRRSSGRF